MKYIHTPEDIERAIIRFGDSPVLGAPCQKGGYSVIIAGPQEVFGELDLNQFPTQRLIIGIHTWPPGKSCGSHNHTNREESYYIFAGQAEITVGDERKVVGAGSSAYMPPKVKHDLASVGDETLVAVVVGAVLDEDEVDAWETLSGQHLRGSKRAWKYIHTPADYDGAYAGDERGYTDMVAGPHSKYGERRTLKGEPLECFPSVRMAYSFHNWEPGKSHGSHRHRDMEQCYYVLAGRADVTIDGKLKTVGPGSSGHNPLEMQHDIVAIGDETLVVGVIGCMLE